MSDEYQLLDAFQRLFDGQPYLHRIPNQGDMVVRYMFEDLRSMNRSSALTRHIDHKLSVVNLSNNRVGIRSRRGDGSFGERAPAAQIVEVPGFKVALGELASIEIGAEAKILAKAMIKQIDRVIGDLLRQVQEFKRSGNPICVGVVGVNFASGYTSFEGERSFTTTGTSKAPHPVQEAIGAVERLQRLAKPEFDEFLVLRFRASNVAPYPFEWLDQQATRVAYSALLARISTLYQARFRDVQ